MSPLKKPDEENQETDIICVDIASLKSIMRNIIEKTHTRKRV
jgi:hypothetical protein